MAAIGLTPGKKHKKPFSLHFLLRFLCGESYPSPQQKPETPTIVAEQLILEITSVERLLPLHEAQLLIYLWLSGLKIGLLLNFNSCCFTTEFASSCTSPPRPPSPLPASSSRTAKPWRISPIGCSAWWAASSWRSKPQLSLPRMHDSYW